MNPKFKIIIGIIVLVVVVIAVSSMKGTDKGGDTITIGVMFPLTGDAAVYGEPSLQSTQLALDEINAAGGIKGKKLVAIVEDDKCIGKEGANAAGKLIKSDGVKLIYGSFCSSATLSAIPIAAEAKAAVFSPGASSPALTGVSPYFFRNYPSDASQGKVLAEVAFTDKGWKKAAIIQEQTDYAVGVYKSFSETYTALGGTMVKDEFPTPTTDFRSLISKAKASGAQVVFIDTQTPAAAERILKQMSEMKWKPNIIINDAIAGDQATMMNNKVMLEGAISAEFGVDAENPKFKHLLEAYQAKYGKVLPYQSYAQTMYDGIYMLKDGIEAVGYDGEKLAAWARTVKDWDGASGKITILPNGDRASGHVAKVVKDGKVELYVK